MAKSAGPSCPFVVATLPICSLSRVPGHLRVADLLDLLGFDLLDSLGLDLVGFLDLLDPLGDRLVAQNSLRNFKWM